MMDCSISQRPQTVGFKPQSYNYSDFIMQLLQEIGDEANSPKLKSKPPQKNYLKENLKRVKEIQAQMKQRNTQQQPLQPLKVPNKYSQVQSKVSALVNTQVYPSRERMFMKPTDINPPPKTAGSYRNHPPRSPCLSSKSDTHRSLQTYKSLPQLNHAKDDETTQYSHNEELSPRSDDLSEKSYHTYCKNSQDDLKSEKKLRLGHIPNYLTERKKQWEIERERQIKLLEEASIPPGHTLLPDEERLETLELLKKNQEELLQNLSALPVRNDTIRLRSYKEDLERQLAKVEEGIKIFSRPKVLIKNDT
ncbi:enkurin domain-containing protein 1-like [Uloborus diversus]|uniref:enkurin domain-containing protein 1-like n=1 Tax=Uloborus diversus TaxID=327109 RepID=UPI00240A86C6|nr:enkurin domain-containing protein 1-like [Uloborus diversus]